MERGQTGYELPQIILTREGNTHQVVDGQQRLVTLCLLYAALRDTVLNGKDSITEVQQRLVIGGYNKPEVNRFLLRKSENEVFDRILSEPGSQDYVQSLLKKKTKLPAPISSMVTNYSKLCSLLKDRDRDLIDNLYAFLNDHVYLIITIPESTRIARRLCMSQGKGKNTEPIDELKGMVIFGGIEEEDMQNKCLEQWHQLEESVGRPILNDACLLMAQAELKERVKRDEETDKLEDFWKRYSKNFNNQSQDNEEVMQPGMQFFREVVEPGAKALRDGTIYQGQILGSADQSLRFIHDAATISTAKEIEIAGLHALRYGKRYDKALLHTLERNALLFATTGVKLRERCDRVFKLVDAIEHGTNEISRLDLTPEEVDLIVTSLDETLWGATGPKKKSVKAILQLMNAKILAEKSQAAVQAPKIDIEHILPQKPHSNSTWKVDWTTEELADWTHRLGNLCLLNPTRNSAVGNYNFVKKSPLLGDMPYPLTSQIAINFKTWTPADVERQHDHLLSLAKRTFSL